MGRASFLPVTKVTIAFNVFEEDGFDYHGLNFIIETTNEKGFKSRTRIQTALSCIINPEEFGFLVSKAIPIAKTLSENIDDMVEIYHEGQRITEWSISAGESSCAWVDRLFDPFSD